MRKTAFGLIFLFSIAWAQEETVPSSARPAGQQVGKNVVVQQNVGLEQGVDFDQQDPEMNDYYIRGPYLVYDCIGEYWVCTGKPEWDRCARLRTTRSEDFDQNLGCATFVGFKTIKDCQDYQLTMTSRGGGTRFCLHPEQRKKEFDY